MKPSFVESWGPWALVLGASEGLGHAWANALASRGLNVVVVARRRAEVERVAEDLAAAHGVATRALVVDLASPDAPDALFDATADLDVGLVVYNASYSRIGEFLSLSADEVRGTVAVNVTGVATVVHRLAPRLVERGRGGIVIMSSLSGFQGTAMVGVYAATKAFDTALGEVLWEELRHHGVHVMVCAAGAISTPNFERLTPEHRRANAMPMPAADVVAQAVTALHARRGPVFIPGAVNRWVYRVAGQLPRGAAVRFLSSQTRKIYEAP